MTWREPVAPTGRHPAAADREAHETRMGYDAGYFDRDYFRLHPGKVGYLRAVADRLLAATPPSTSPPRVLDLGAGFGFLVDELGRRGVAAWGLEHALLACAHATPPRRLLCADADALPFGERSFTAVACCDVIEHLVTPQTTLAECHRVLQPGGVLLVITLNAHSVARPLLGRDWAWYQDPTHLHLFSRPALGRALRTAGFARVRVETFFNFHSVGESTPRLRPLARLRRFVTVPWVGDALLALAWRSPSSRGDRS